MRVVVIFANILLQSANLARTAAPPKCISVLIGTQQYLHRCSMGLAHHLEKKLSDKLGHYIQSANMKCYSNEREN